MNIRKNLSVEEISEIKSALDLVSRVYLGQYDEILFQLGIYRSDYSLYHSLINLFKDIRVYYIPKIGTDFNTSLGIWNEDGTPLEAMRMYDILQIIRYQQSLNNTTTFSCEYPPFIHGKWKLKDEDVKQLETIMQKYDYLDYYPYSLRGKYWKCPLIIESFENNSVNLLMSQSINKIVNKAKRIYNLLMNKNIIEAFEKLYGKKIEDASLIENFKEIEKILKMSSDMDKFFQNYGGDN